MTINVSSLNEALRAGDHYLVMILKDPRSKNTTIYKDVVKIHNYIVKRRKNKSKKISQKSLEQLIRFFGNLFDYYSGNSNKYGYATVNVGGLTDDSVDDLLAVADDITEILEEHIMDSDDD